MFTGLTLAQIGTLKDLQKAKIKLAFIGVDGWMSPVVWVMDQRRRFCMAIRADGRGTAPELPVRQLTEDESGRLSERDADMLFLYMKDVLPTTYRLQERWYTL